MAHYREKRRHVVLTLSASVAAWLACGIARAEAPPAAASPPPPASSASAAPIPYELTRPARPPLPPKAEVQPVPWRDQIQLGGDAIYAVRTVHADNGSGIRYAPALGFGLHARWDMFSFLRFSAYFVDARHDVPKSAGVLPCQPLACGALELGSIHTFVFGARFQPMVRVTTRLRTWLSLGFGWGRIEVPQMQVVGAKGTFFVRERADPFVEFPLGFGVGFDVIRDWLALEYEFHGAFISDQGGEAVNPMLTVDADGHTRQIGGFPPFAASFTHALALTLRL